MAVPVLACQLVQTGELSRCNASVPPGFSGGEEAYFVNRQI